MTEPNAEQSTAEREAASAAAFDARQAEVQAATPAPAASSETPPADRPSWLPEGMNTPEDLAAAYAALQAKQQAPASETPPNPENASAEQAAEAAAAAGIDFAALETEFAENDGLTEDTYKMLEGKGFNRETVDRYIAGQTALADRIQTEVYDTVGGVEGYSAMTAWAAQNLTPSEIKAFDDAVTNGSVETIKMAVAGLNARYRDAEGSEPNLLGGQGGNSSTDVFRSTAEVTRAMSDARYQKDPAYRAEVEAKIGRSSIF